MDKGKQKGITLRMPACLPAAIVERQRLCSGVWVSSVCPVSLYFMPPCACSLGSGVEAEVSHSLRELCCLAPILLSDDAIWTPQQPLHSER